jgi:hypothetical protein
VAGAAVPVAAEAAVPGMEEAAVAAPPAGGRGSAIKFNVCWWFPPISRRPVRNRILEEVGSHTGKVTNRPDGNTDT